MSFRVVTWPVFALVVASVALPGCGGGDDDDRLGTGGNGGGTTQPAEGSQPGEDEANFRTIAEGPRGPLRAGEVVARSRAEWEAAWRDHEGPSDPPSIDEVDFSRSALVAVFAGQRPTGGFRVVPGAVVPGEGGSYVVSYEVVSPGQGCVASQGLTSPFLVMSIPMAQQVTFSSAERAQDCQ